jgi:hypothetical protein
VDVTTEVNELAARIAALPDDAQQALAWRVLKQFGYETPEEAAARQAAWEVELRADREALFAWEKANGKWPGDYRAAG